MTFQQGRREGKQTHRCNRERNTHKRWEARYCMRMFDELVMNESELRV